MRSPVERPSPNFDRRPTGAAGAGGAGGGAAVDMVVFHYTGMEDAESALTRLCDPAAKVSAHYVIDEDGTVFALVDEGCRAWHTGAAWWRGNSDVNGRSLGIELVNPGHEFGYRPFADAQMAALQDLARDILARHPIPPRNVVGHSDVAPRRKCDPGELFDWARLAAAGIGLWPGASEPREAEGAEVASLLADFGYETDDMDAALGAFQRHFRQVRVDGVADAETVGLLDAVLRLIP